MQLDMGIGAFAVVIVTALVVEGASQLAIYGWSGQRYRSLAPYVWCEIAHDDLPGSGLSLRQLGVLLASTSHGRPSVDALDV